MPFSGMLHSPSSFEVYKPLLAGISRCVQELSSTPGELGSRSHYLVPYCLCSAQSHVPLTVCFLPSLLALSTCQEPSFA